MRLIAFALVFWLAALTSAGPAAAQTKWPEMWRQKPARLFAQKFSETWGQSVIVDNITGNSGAIGVDKVAKAAPDGYTLMWSGNAAITVLPALQPLPFDPLKDFAPISIALSMPSVIAVNNDLPVKTLAELIAYAKANPGKLSYGTPGIGTPQHVAGALFCHLAGIKMEHIPYRGANFNDTLGGVVPVAIQNAGAIMPLIRDGRLRRLAVTALKRSQDTSNLPTVDESGFKGFEVGSWFALLAPAGTPPAIVEKVRAESLKVLADPDMAKKFAALGLQAVGSTPERTHATIAADIPKWAQVVKEAHIILGN